MNIYNTEGYLPSFDQEKIWFKTYSQVVPEQTRGPRLILIHGLSNDAQIWEGVIETILAQKPRTQIITYDLRGHGSSSQKFHHLTQSHPYIEQVHVADLRHVIENFGGVRPILVGHSFGGIIIQEYLLQTKFNWFDVRRPRATVLVACDTQAFQVKIIDRQKIMANLMQLAPSQKSSPRKRDFEFYRDHYAQKNHDTTPLSIFYAISNMSRENFVRHWLGVANWYNSDPQKMLKKLGAHRPWQKQFPPKIVLIYATKDSIFSVARIERTLAKYPPIKGVAVNCNHALPVKQPEAVAKEILEFL